MSQNRQTGPYLRRLKAEDAELIYDIERQVYGEPWTLNLLRDSLQAPMTHGLGVFQNEKVLAYGIFQVILSEGHLLNIAVNPSFHRQGIGSYLLDQMIDEIQSRGATTFYLEVRLSNSSARSLYEKKGFKPLMIRERYYADGEDALIMILNLKAKAGS